MRADLVPDVIFESAVEVEWCSVAAWVRASREATCQSRSASHTAPGSSWLEQVLPDHYEHPSGLQCSTRCQLISVGKP